MTQSPQEFIDRLLPYKEELENLKESIATSDDILHKLIPEYKFKLGKGLVELAFERTKKIIENFISSGTPIELIVNIGTSKWFNGTNTERNVAGLSELLMFEQMAHINRRVKSVYGQGVKWNILAEDLTNDWLYSRLNDAHKIAENNKVYLESIMSMLHTVSDNLKIQCNFTKESDLIMKNSIGISRYIDLLEKNQKIFLEFLNATALLEERFLKDSNSQEWDDSLWTKFSEQILPDIPQYEILFNNGWSGGVHPLQREYYVNQFEKSGGNAASKLDYVSAYFGSILARRQMKFPTLVSEKQSIKFAFIRYPNGTSDREKTAITISQHPLYGYGSCHKRISPWASVTNIEVSAESEMSLRVRPVRIQDKEPLGISSIAYAGVTVPVLIFEKDKNV